MATQEEVRRWLEDFQRQGPSPKLIGFGFVILLLVGALWSCFFEVPTEAEAVVLRFGKFNRVVPSGLHLKFPWGVEEEIIVPVKRQLKLEFGFGTRNATNQWQRTDASDWASQSAMVTGDLNAALVEWVIQYRIDKPNHYLFNVRNPLATLRDASESVMREVVGDRTVDEVITIGRQEIESDALLKLQKLVIEYEMGVKIDQVQLKNVNPPKKVQASFNEVNQAQQEKESAINIANGEYNKEVPRAKGEAEQAISAARGYAEKRINEAKGDVAAFKAILVEYLKSPEVTKRRIYLETMEEVLPKIKNKIIFDSKGGSGLLPFLNLDKTLKVGK